MWISRAAVYLSLALAVAAIGMPLIWQRQDSRDFPPENHFHDVRATDGAVLRVERGRLDLLEGGNASVEFSPQPRGTNTLLMACGAALIVQSVMLSVLLDRERDRRSISRP